MKIKNTIGLITLPSLLFACMTALLNERQKASEVKAYTDVGEISMGEVRNAISSATAIYLLPTQDYGLPDSWDIHYQAAGDEDGVFINGTKSPSSYLCYAGTGSAHTTIYLGLSTAAVEGDVVEFKGSFVGGDYSFSLNYATQRFAGTWVHALEDYDVVSFEDANIPNFENVTINTEDAAGYDYVTDAATLPMKKGFLGLTNNTGSYSFQFYFKKAVKSPGWFEVRIGGAGSWGTGHFLKYSFSTEWNIKGCGFVYEYQGNGNIWAPTELQKSSEFVPNFTGGNDLLEMGTIKVKGYTNKFLVFVKNNGSLLWNGYWNLDSAGRTTKVGLYYPQDDVIVTNSINLTATETLSITSGTNSIRLETANDICPAVSNIDDYFKSVNGNGLKLNGVAFGNDKWDFFKKIGSKTYALEFSEAGIDTINEGDVLYIGGLFKAAREVNGVKVLFKALFADNYFRFDGTNWQNLTPEQYDEFLAQYKIDAKSELDYLVNSEIYDTTNIAIVQNIVDDAKTAIDSAITLDEVVTIVQDAKDDIAVQAKTRQQVLEEEILNSSSLLTQYLEPYDVITTTDLCAVGNLVFRSKAKGSYSSGGYDDTTAWLATSENNLDGNMIFQFNYESTDPLVSEYGSQIYIRMRSDTDDSNCYRFEVGTRVGEDSGVGLCVFHNNHDEGRITYNAHFEKNTSYKIECGSIDLDGYSRTLLFIKIENTFVLKKIVDSFDEQKPTLRIMDSYTTGDEVTIMSPIEEGTTKTLEDNSSLLGRLILDPSSNGNNLYVTLKENSFPNEAVLLPVQEGAFTINGNAIDSFRSVTNVKKIDDKKYLVEFDMTGLADNDTVKIGGLFSYLGADFSKTLYRFFNTEFVYHSDSNSWTQALPTDRETILFEANQTLDNYVNKSDYSTENQNKIDEIIAACKADIAAAETSDIADILSEALAKIDEIPTILIEARAAAKNELAAYKSDVSYRSEEQAEKAQILANANAEIDAAIDQNSISAIVANAKTLIDALKTAAQRNEEDLAANKKSARAEVTSLSSLLESDRYSEENYETLTTLTLKAIQDIDKATSEEEIAQILAKYRNDIKAVKTNDGSIFDGEKYTKEEKNGSNKTTTAIIIAASVGGALLVGGGVTAGILLSKKKRRLSNEKD